MPSVYRIGDLTLDAGRQELRRDADRIHLGPLTYKLLLALVEAAPRMLGHDDLAEAVWDGRAVSQETISQRIKLLREALGDDAHQPRYVEIVRGRGYRLIPTVSVVSSRKAGRSRLPLAIALGTLLAISAAALVWLLSSHEPSRSSHSIAVLPFADLSAAQDQEYFADGIAEEILNLLSRTTGLRVIARTSSFSFKGRSTDIATIARQLDVTHVLEGSVRKSGSRIRVAVQLVAAPDGTHVWSDSYDMHVGDVLELQNQVGRSVAAALEINLLGQDSFSQTEPARVHPEAFEAYLRGLQQRRIHSGPTFAAAERYFKQSIDIDPDFLPAYSSLGTIYVVQILDVQATVSETVAKLRGIVKRGLELAPDDAGLTGLRGQLARYNGNMELAEQQFRRGLELDPSNLTVLVLWATFRLDQGRPSEALQIVQRLLQLDPLNPELYITIWACHMDMWNAAQAIEATRNYNEAAAEPGAPAFGLRGLTKAVLLGDVAGGIRDIARAETIATGGANRSYAHPAWYYSLGDLRNGDAALEVYRDAFASDPHLGIALVYRHLARGEIDAARDLALSAFEGRPDFSALAYDRVIARLATDALIARGEAERAVELIERMAPVYERYRSQSDISPEDFSPAPYPVKGTQSSYPALYFPDYIRALRAAGDDAGAERMLEHMEAILQLRRKRALFIEARHVAEARALRGDLEGALDALERAERDRTIYAGWHVFLLYNEIFEGIRHDPRFEALLARVADEMRRQRAQLNGTPGINP